MAENESVDLLTAKFNDINHRLFKIGLNQITPDNILVTNMMEYDFSLEF